MVQMSASAGCRRIYRLHVDVGVFLISRYASRALIWLPSCGNADQLPSACRDIWNRVVNFAVLLVIGSMMSLTGSSSRIRCGRHVVIARMSWAIWPEPVPGQEELLPWPVM